MGFRSLFKKIFGVLQSSESTPQSSARARAVQIEIAPPPQYESVIFELDEAQIRKLNEWISVVHVRAANMQIESGFADKFGSGRAPYYGAIGGGYTFSFSTTGLGTVCKVRETFTKEEIDLTDYDQW